MHGATVFNIIATPFRNGTNQDESIEESYVYTTDYLPEYGRVLDDSLSLLIESETSNNIAIITAKYEDLINLLSNKNFARFNSNDETRNLEIHQYIYAGFFALCKNCALYNLDLETELDNYLKSIEMTDEIILVDPNGELATDKENLQWLEEENAVGLAYNNQNKRCIIFKKQDDLQIMSMSPYEMAENRNIQHTLSTLLHELRHTSTRGIILPRDISELNLGEDIEKRYEEFYNYFCSMIKEGEAVTAGNLAYSEIIFPNTSSIEGDLADEEDAIFISNSSYPFYSTLFDNLKFLTGDYLTKAMLEDTEQNGNATNSNRLLDMKDIIDGYGEGKFKELFVSIINLLSSYSYYESVYDLKIDFPEVYDCFIAYDKLSTHFPEVLELYMHNQDIDEAIRLIEESEYDFYIKREAIGALSTLSSYNFEFKDDFIQQLNKMIDTTSDKTDKEKSEGKAALLAIVSVDKEEVRRASDEAIKFQETVLDCLISDSKNKNAYDYYMMCYSYLMSDNLIEIRGNPHVYDLKIEELQRTALQKLQDEKVTIRGYTFGKDNVQDEIMLKIIFTENFSEISTVEISKVGKMAEPNEEMLQERFDKAKQKEIENINSMIIRYQLELENINLEEDYREEIREEYQSRIQELKQDIKRIEQYDLDSILREQENQETDFIIVRDNNGNILSYNLIYNDEICNFFIRPNGRVIPFKDQIIFYEYILNQIKNANTFKEITEWNYIYRMYSSLGYADVEDKEDKDLLTYAYLMYEDDIFTCYINSCNHYFMNNIPNAICVEAIEKIYKEYCEYLSLISYIYKEAEEYEDIIKQIEEISELMLNALRKNNVTIMGYTFGENQELDDSIILKSLTAVYDAENLSTISIETIKNNEIKIINYKDENGLYAYSRIWYNNDLLWGVGGLENSDYENFCNTFCSYYEDKINNLNDENAKQEIIEIAEMFSYLIYERQDETSRYDYSSFFNLLYKKFVEYGVSFEEIALGGVTGKFGKNCYGEKIEMVIFTKYLEGYMHITDEMINCNDIVPDNEENLR